MISHSTQSYFFRHEHVVHTKHILSNDAKHVQVDLLVPVMERLATWTRPVVMIPGNHDQVTLGGGVHALTPLQFAFADPKQVRKSLTAVSARLR